jgi:hypothetical protein
MNDSGLDEMCLKIKTAMYFWILDIFNANELERQGRELIDFTFLFHNFGNVRLTYYSKIRCTRVVL